MSKTLKIKSTETVTVPVNTDALNATDRDEAIWKLRELNAIRHLLSELASGLEYLDLESIEDDIFHEQMNEFIDEVDHHRLWELVNKIEDIRGDFATRNNLDDEDRAIVNHCPVKINHHA